MGKACAPRLALSTTAVLFALVVAGPSAAGAQADTGPFFEPAPPNAKPQTGAHTYQLRLSAAVDYANRTDFSRPIVLVRQPVRRIDALQVTGQLDFRLALAPNLSLQAIAPLVFRDLDVHLDGVLLSQTAQLTGRRLPLQGLGFGDASLAAAYRFLSLDALCAFVDAGASVPLDDNPGSNTLPNRAPAGDGQGELFVGAGGNGTFGDLGLSLAYRFGFQPQATATYLITNTANQAYASGALGPRTRHVVTGLFMYSALAWLSLSLAPQLSAQEAPTVVDRGQALAVITAPWLVQVSLRAAIRVGLGRDHALELFYRQPLLSPWRIDPLFPLAMPAQGGGIMWVVSGS